MPLRTALEQYVVTSGRAAIDSVAEPVVVSRTLICDVDLT